MHTLFQARHVNVLRTLKAHFKSPEPLTHISYSQISPKTLNPISKLDFLYNQVESLSASSSLENTEENESMVQISHPWPEWVDFMQLLWKRGYFPKIGNPFGLKEANFIRTACLSFARDQSGLIRYLSREDMEVIVGCGCPRYGKCLRSLVGINEGNVCSRCRLRGDCDRAYVNARRGAQTVDVMRILLAYGLDLLSDITINGNKLAEESVGRLLKDVVQYCKRVDADLPKFSVSKSASSPVTEHPSIKIAKKKGDWICKKCSFVNFARNIKCLRCNDLSEERLRRMKEDQDHLPLKKGDWICERCNYLNFAKNTRCLLCEEKPPKRHLNPGEWECESCNYINFRNNMICLKCDHKRPKASKASTVTTQPETEGRSRAKRSVTRFTFVDTESNNEKSGESRNGSRSEGASTWRFVDEGREDNALVSTNEDSGYVDFPIKGGKRKKRTQSTEEKSEGNAGDANFQRKFEEDEVSDDDMRGWFRQH